MKHLEIEQLKKYGERRLSGEEMTNVLLHLDGCRACFDSFQTMFPALSDAAREVSLDVLTASDAEVFHLDYDEHLRPFVDYEADEATREIVESHLENCLFCARAVRELREFSGSLHLRRVKKGDVGQPTFFGGFGSHRRSFSNGNAWLLSLPAITILILGFGGWLLWRQSESPNFIAQNQTSKDAPPVSANENSFDRQTENSLVKPENKRNTLPSAGRGSDSANKKLDAAGDKSGALNALETERLLAALPPDFRVQFQNVLQTQKIKLPAFIAELRADGNLRGGPNDERKPTLSPNAQAVRDLRPTFRWRKFADGESYLITIYDKDFNQVAVSPVLQATKWQSNVLLERGKIYKWQVKTAKSAETFAAQFKVLDAEAAAGLRKIEIAAPRSPLVRGIGYAAEGLLTEAAQEFQKEINKNPRKKLARILKDSLVKKPKR